MKSAVVLLFVTAFFTAGCGLMLTDTCGMFGASSSYRDEFVVDRPFEPIELAVGQTLILRPATHVHINYTYTGNPSCDGEDYQDDPSYVHPTVRHDSLATAEEFYDYDAEPLWRGTEMKVRLTGRKAGQTVLELVIEWRVETRDYYLTQSKTFEMPVTVTEP